MEEHDPIYSLGKTFSWNKRKGHLENRLGYLLSLPEVEKLILPSIYLPFVWKQCQNLPWGSRCHLLSDCITRWASFPTPELGLSCPPGQSMNLFIPSYSYGFRNVPLPQIDPTRMNYETSEGIIMKKHWIFLSTCIWEPGALCPCSLKLTVEKSNLRIKDWSDIT